jgi:hypothetical protein
MEIAFFISADALKRIQPDLRYDEDGIVSAFDANRDLIEDVAAKIYGRGRKGSYELGPTDF